MIDTLDCAFCGADVPVPVDALAAFDALARHVSMGCPPVRRAPAARSLRQGRFAMGSSYDRQPASTSTNDGLPWLKINDVSPKGTKLVFTGKAQDYTSQYGDGVAFEVKANGKLYEFRVKFESGNMGRLKKLAPKQSQLKGKSVLVGLREHLGRDYVAILDTDRPGKKNVAKASRGERTVGRARRLARR